MIQVTHTFHNGDRPHTIYGRLETKLGCAPTHNEIIAEVNRILDEAITRHPRRFMRVELVL